VAGELLAVAADGGTERGGTQAATSINARTIATRWLISLGLRPRPSTTRADGSTTVIMVGTESGTCCRASLGHQEVRAGRTCMPVEFVAQSHFRLLDYEAQVDLMQARRGRRAPRLSRVR
jgi:hypothetical protein